MDVKIGGLGVYTEAFADWFVNVYKAKELDKNVRPGSNAASELYDPFYGGYSGADGLLQPPYDPSILHFISENNNTLMQCVNAMAQNIEGFGHEFVYDLSDSDIRRQYEAAINEESERLHRFFKYVTPTMDFVELRKKLRIDLETTGNAYLELIRTSDKRLVGFEHLPAVTMRLTQKERDYIESNIKIPIPTPTGYEYTEEYAMRRFRKYCQVVNYVGAGTSFSKVWYKEYGDPREMDKTSGRYLEEGKVGDAHEVVHFKIDNTRYEYGIPRWIGNLLAALGSRDADEVNNNFFQNGGLYQMAVLVSGGSLNQRTAEKLAKLLNRTKGKDFAHTALILETETPDNLNLQNINRSKVDIKPLNKHTDMLFEKYQEYTTNRIRSSFRIAPIYIGMIQDYTNANAETSKEVTEEQVFQPERLMIDNFINRFVFPELDVKFHRFSTKGPSKHKAEQAAKVMEAFKDVITGREARELLDTVTEIELSDVDEDTDINQLFLNYPPTIAQKMLDAGAVMSQVPGGLPEDDIEQPPATDDASPVSLDDVGAYMKGARMLGDMVRLEKRLMKEKGE